MSPAPRRAGLSILLPMARLCPWCCERLPARRSDLEACPSCGRPLHDDTGGELRPVDLRWTTVEADLWSRIRTILALGTPAVALVVLLTPPLAGPVVAALAVAIHLLVLRLAVVVPVQRLVGPRRRMLNRWVTRLLVLWVALPGYGAAVVPLAGALVAAGAFAVVTLGCGGYALRSLHLERDRAEPPAWETALVAGLAVLTVAGLAIVAVLVLAIGWTVGELLGRLL